MSIRMQKAAKKRVQRKVKQINAMALLKSKSRSQDRTEVLSTIKHIDVVRG